MSTSTETASARFASIEDWTSLDLVSGILEGQFAAIAAVQAASASVAKAIDAASDRLKSGGRLIYMGAGTSGRIAAQDGAELPPTFNWPHARVITLMAGGSATATTSAESAEDDEDMARDDLARIVLAPGDVVIALAASGRTPYAIAGLVEAGKTGALTIGIYNNSGGPLGDVSDIPILIETGPEVLAGSTRMKAGTAQKATLNAISTGIMIKLGYVYRGMMVEMVPSNIKLVDRAARMVSTLTGADYQTASRTLEAAGNSIKLATVMLAKSLDLQQAETVLTAAEGNLRRALDQGAPMATPSKPSP